MTQPLPPPVPTPLAYQPATWQAARDAEHLRLLAIGHYVYGGLVIGCSSLFVVHIVLGIVALRNPALLTGPTTAPGPPPQWFGYLFTGMGTAMVLVGWGLGIVNIISGRFIRRRRARLFSLVVAGLNCTNLPFGVLMGVFTFVVLLRDSVRALYENRGVFAGPTG